MSGEKMIKIATAIYNKYFFRYSDIREDLINEGCLGLIKAAEKFNPEYNVKFISYAVFWIKTYMQRAIREKFTGIKFPAKAFLRPSVLVPTINSVGI